TLALVVNGGPYADDVRLRVPGEILSLHRGEVTVRAARLVIDGFRRGDGVAGIGKVRWNSVLARTMHPGGVVKRRRARIVVHEFVASRVDRRVRRDDLDKFEICAFGAGA